MIEQIVEEINNNKELSTSARHGLIKSLYSLEAAINNYHLRQQRCKNEILAELEEYIERINLILNEVDK